MILALTWCNFQYFILYSMKNSGCHGNRLEIILKLFYKTPGWIWILFRYSLWVTLIMIYTACWIPPVSKLLKQIQKIPNTLFTIQLGERLRVILALLFNNWEIVLHVAETEWYELRHCPLGIDNQLIDWSIM